MPTFSAGISPCRSRAGTADIRVQLGNRVRSLRRDRGWTQVEMAEMLGVDRRYLSEIENGKKDPSLRVLKTIADGFRRHPFAVAARDVNRH
ncbi:MAG TPA: helix-turn-helix transcriptional regulator [Clostridia bacterium]|nr:helix-turn-helix transcriptional regulator [Clostridia bacterium]